MIIVVCSSRDLLWGYTVAPQDDVSVEQVFDGGDLLHRLQAGPWDMAIVAAMMPTHDGVEVCHRCNSRGRTVVLVFPSPIPPVFRAEDAGLPDVLVVDLPRQSDYVNSLVENLVNR